MHNDERALSEREATMFLGLRPQTLANMRCQRRGPAYRKLGTRVVYILKDLIAYRDARLVDPEATRSRRERG